jgi:hypothetical protein
MKFSMLAIAVTAFAGVQGFAGVNNARNFAVRQVSLNE